MNGNGLFIGKVAVSIRIYEQVEGASLVSRGTIKHQSLGGVWH